jgi:hypothetical protein
VKVGSTFGKKPTAESPLRLDRAARQVDLSAAVAS